VVPVKQIQFAAARDEDLLKNYQSSGDQNLLAALYLRYTDWVYGACLKYLKDTEAAKDATLSIYEELIVKLKTHHVENFKSWLYVVAKNYCLMQLRKSKQHMVVELPGAVMQTEDFSHLDSVLEKENELKRLENCIGTLNDEQNAVIKLFYLENKCYNEITNITGLDWNKVRSLIQNGRRNLKICMEENAS
jgi:RNA polymerase sigma factor, sigma-70 family